MSVVEFPKAQPHGEFILVCSCGCTTFRIVSTTREFECSVCNNRLPDLVSAIPYEAIGREERPRELSSRDNYGSVDLAFHATLRRASVDGTAAVAVCNNDGMVYTWVGDGVRDDAEGLKWLRTQARHVKDQWLR